MQSHLVLWNVSLSNGENFRECTKPFLEVPELSPWQQLERYLEEVGAHVTSVWLSSPNGTRFNLPPISNRHPRSRIFLNAEKPILLRAYHKNVSGTGGLKEWFAIAEAQYPTYKLQLWVSEHDPKVSWVIAVMNNETVLATR
jgi:hypothetical protein